MTTVDDWMREPPRNGRGQYLMADENGTVTGRTRATTFAKAASDDASLTNWKLRSVVDGLAKRSDLYGLAVAAAGQRDALRSVAERALEAGGGDVAANSGTAMHGMLEAIAKGKLTLDSVPVSDRADAEAYFRELSRHGITEHPSMMERTVYVKTYNVGGTLDRIYTWQPCPICGITDYIGDIKTGKDLSYGEHEYAIQLALYANADVVFERGSAENFDAMPDVCRHTALILHVPHGKGQAYAETIDIQAGWWAARICHQVRQWRSLKGLRTPMVPSPIAAPEVVYGSPGETEAELPIGVQPHPGDPFEGIPLPDETEVYVQDEPVDYDAMANDLFEASRKSKPVMQSMARELMTLDHSVPIKIAQYAIKIAGEIVRHPAWPEHSEALIAKYIPRDRRKKTVKEEQDQHADRQVERIKLTTSAAVPTTAEEAVASTDQVEELSNPFAEVARDEAFYLDAVSKADSKRALAALWQDAADNGVEWGDTLNAAGMVRMKELANILGTS